MANTKQSRKRILQSEKRRLVNISRLSRIRTFIRKVDDAVKAKTQDVALEALRVAQIEIMKGGSKGTIHKRTASRWVSRLAHRVKKAFSLYAAA